VQQSKNNKKYLKKDTVLIVVVVFCFVCWNIRVSELSVHRLLIITPNDENTS
jgi:hypothetical protein